MLMFDVVFGTSKGDAWYFLGLVLYWLGHKSPNSFTLEENKSDTCERVAKQLNIFML